MLSISRTCIGNASGLERQKCFEMCWISDMRSSTTDKEQLERTPVLWPFYSFHDYYWSSVWRHTPTVWFHSIQQISQLYLSKSEKHKALRTFLALICFNHIILFTFSAPADSFRMSQSHQLLDLLPLLMPGLHGLAELHKDPRRGFSLQIEVRGLHLKALDLVLPSWLSQSKTISTILICHALCCAFWHDVLHSDIASRLHLHPHAHTDMTFTLALYISICM